MPMAIASFSNLSFAISTVRFLMCGGACSRVMKTEPSLMSSTVASTIWSVSSTGSLRVHIRRSLHQDARTRRGREADAPTVPGRGRGGGVPHTRSLANRHAGVVRLVRGVPTHALLFGVCERRSPRLPCPGGEIAADGIFLRTKFQSSYCVLVSSVARGCPLPNPNQVRGRALGATVSDARRPRAGR